MNTKMIPVTYNDLNNIIICATNNKAGLTYNPLQPLQLAPSKVKLTELYDTMSKYLFDSKQTIINILAACEKNITDTTIYLFIKEN